MRSHVKVMLTVFFDAEVVVRYEFLPQDRTVNKEYYLEVMQRLRQEKQTRCVAGKSMDAPTRQRALTFIVPCP